MLYGLLQPIPGRSDSWSVLGYLLHPTRLLATRGDGLLLGPAVYLAFTVFFRLPDLARRLRDQDLYEARWRRAVQPGYQSLSLRRALKRRRGHPLARFAGMAPSTLSRALTGQPVAPTSWQALITALAHTQH